ncbi:ankyrin repeat domain-containing protein [Trinickia fusca]|uniref:Ankyrin repeat domain-containing protein n=2 Tax=Trinickia fusca TaxID=2419777 RepID=A0A494X8W8_9BURK|nr:ankyrin repeat domain-containing protein [Trinickia fusca]
MIGDGFSKAFLSTDMDSQHGAQAASKAEPPTALASVWYSPERHGSVVAFERSADHHTFIVEVGVALAGLIKFARYRCDNHVAIAHNLQEFRNRVVNCADSFYSTTREVLYGVGKQLLDQLCRLIAEVGDDVKGNDPRMCACRAAVEELARGLDKCAPAAVSHLASAVRCLMLASDGVRAASWQGKEQLAKALILESVRANHARESGYLAYEIHYYNAYANRIAERIGLPAVDDIFTRSLRISETQFDRCEELVKSKLTPGHLALMLGDECLADASERLSRALEMPVHQLRAGFSYDDKAVDAVKLVMDELDRKYGKGTCKDGSILEFDVEDPALCRLHRDPSLLALNILDAQRTDGLLDPQYQRKLVEKWTVAGHSPNSKYTVGVWHHERELVWATLNDEAEPLRVSHLEKLKGLKASLSPEARELSAAIVRRVIDNEDSKKLQNLSIEWLDEHHVDRLIDKLDGAQFLTFLAAKSSDGYPRLYEAMRHDHVDVVRVFAKAAARGLTRGVIDDKQFVDLMAAMSEDGTPALHAALVNGHDGTVDAFINEVSAALEQRAIGSDQFVTLLSAKSSEGYPGLYEAMKRNHVKAVKEFVIVVAQGFRRGVIDAKECVDLMAAMSGDGTPALHAALANGHLGTVNAFIERLVQMSFYSPRITGDQFVTLLSARSSEGNPGLYEAMAHNHADVVKKFALSVRGAREMDVISAGQFVDLMAAMSKDGKPALHAALANGHDRTVDEFVITVLNAHKEGLISSDERLTLLAAKSNEGYPGLHEAMRHNHVDVVGVFAKAAAYELIFGTIDAKQFVDLMAAMSEDGTPALHAALTNGHADAVKAFIDEVWRALMYRVISSDQFVTLLAAKNREGCPGLYEAMRHNHVDAVSVFEKAAEEGLRRGVIDAKQFAELTAATPTNGRLGLREALSEGHAGVRRGVLEGGNSGV